MREGNASLTAHAVAAARGFATKARGGVVDPGDDAVFSVLPGYAQAAAHLLSASGRVSPWLPRAAFGMTAGLIDHVLLRTAAIDAITVDFVGAGGDQVVILGAGLDMRGYRMDALSAADVYEVDHPATQSHKRQRLGETPQRCRALHHVEVDFERDDLGARLQDAGHDRARRTLWIWEGVVEYLGLPAVQATLAIVAARSAPGSELAMTYMPRCPWYLVPGRATLQAALRVVGEPLGIQPTPDEVAALLRDAGLSPLSDTNTHDWHARHAQSDHPALIVPYERLAHARR